MDNGTGIIRLLYNDPGGGNGINDLDGNPLAPFNIISGTQIPGQIVDTVP